MVAQGADIVALGNALGQIQNASVALAYINEYPEARKDIDSLVLCVPSTNGVNFAGELFSGKVSVDAEAKIITLNLEIDTAICSVMEYFEIFIERMLLCKRAAEKLGTKFQLVINNQQIL